MKSTIKLAVIGGLMAAGLLQTNAQNIVQNVNIKLKGFAQGDTAQTVKLSNKEALAILGPAVGEDFTGGKLMLVTSGEGSTVVVRRKDFEDFDVSEFLTKEQLTDAVTTDNSSETKTDITSYSINRFTFDAPATDTAPEADFDVQGYTTERTRSVTQGGTSIGDSTDTKATVAGSGHINDQFTILQGSITVSGNKVETVP
jgi:hypothetical protein